MRSHVATLGLIVCVAGSATLAEETQSSVTVKSLISAATSEGLIRPEQFTERTLSSNEMARLHLGLSSPNNLWMKSVPGLLETYEANLPILYGTDQGTDNNALAIRIYRREQKVVLVEIHLNGIDSTNPDRALKTVLAVAQAAVPLHPQTTEWLREAFNESERMGIEYRDRAYVESEGMDLERYFGYLPIIQEQFGDSRVAAYGGEVLGVFIFPE